jgi:SSS family solute:Na+ symporter
MQLVTIDWIILAGSLLVIFLPALFFARRANRGTTEFFASGRAAPWWLVGTSMVATTFATDTPGLVTQLVRESGIAGNWVWWAFLLTGMATVFFYARLWRRAELLTDLEFYEIRYAGKPAAFVRCFRAVYLGLVFNCFIMATVTLAAVKIAGILFGVPAWQTIVGAIVLCSLVSAVSGLWGVLVSDLIQFGFAMTGSFAAAYYALRHPAVDGVAGLLARVDPAKLTLLPDFGNTANAVAVFILPLTVLWWSAWYPGSEPGGGNYVAQRILASRNERHAVGATLWFNVAHYALRPWPWIVVGLASMLVYPDMASIGQAFPELNKKLIDHDIAYPAMLTLLPAGVLGIVTASLVAAYISTMSSQLNVGASYLINDLYRRFLVPGATPRHYVFMSRVATVGLMLISGALVSVLDSARDGFNVLLSIGAGTGLLYLLRWFWWRINAWSEIAAMASSFAVSIALLAIRKYEWLEISDAEGLISVVAVTTAAWLLTTLLTSPESPATLADFCRRIQPAGPGWRMVRTSANIPPARDSLTVGLACWVLGCLSVYAVLFGTGSLLFARTMQGIVLLVIGAAAAAGLFGILLRGRKDVSATP